MDTDSSLTASDSFPVQLRRVALPLIIQQALTSLLGFIDVLMVGQLGARAIAGVGLGNNIAFVYSVIMFGVVGGISIFTAQFWGKKDKGILAFLWKKFKFSAVKKNGYSEVLEAPESSRVVFNLLYFRVHALRVRIRDSVFEVVQQFTQMPL